MGGDDDGSDAASTNSGGGGGSRGAQGAGGAKPGRALATLSRSYTSHYSVGTLRRYEYEKSSYSIACSHVWLGFGICV